MAHKRKTDLNELQMREEISGKANRLRAIEKSKKHVENNLKWYYATDYFYVRKLIQINRTDDGMGLITLSLGDEMYIRIPQTDNVKFGFPCGLKKQEIQKRMIQNYGNLQKFKLR